MEFVGGKPSFLRNVVVRFLLFSLLFVGVRFAYVITIRGESCRAGDDFCFFSTPENHGLVTAAGGRLGSSSSLTLDAAAAPGFEKRVMFYITVFQDLIVDGFLSTRSKSLCVDTPAGDDVYALREIGVDDSIGIHKRAPKPSPLVLRKSGARHPFPNDTFDFTFSAAGALDGSDNPAEFAAEAGRTLKPEGYLVVHTASTDSYSFHSFIDLFNCCKFIRSREIARFDPDFPHIREIIMQKLPDFKIRAKPTHNSNNKCSVPSYKHDLVTKAEPLIPIEPLKPWITLKKNIQNVKYLPSMADISFKHRYIYIDVGARSYGSSIGSWFKKQYPKQNKTFDVYAIEADKHFHDQYKSKKGVKLLPYAAWVRNESLAFEINQTPGDENLEKGRGMGRIRPIKPGGGIVGSVDVIQGFDFAMWLKNTVSEGDFVVMKMDVEGAEFDLIPRLIETGAICLVDEVFLECHYNRWQRCCPGERSPKYRKTYGQCLELFESLRRRGVLVHQWW